MFPNQPEDVKVAWGYGLLVDQVRNKVGKKMRECTGADIPYRALLSPST